jgi:DNA-binding PucR family transcriptional regulator
MRREERGEVIRRCTELAEGSAWIVRCPVYSRHVIVVADSSTGGRRLDAAVASEVGGCVVGTGDVVGLRDTSVGYEQAFHALAMARGQAQRFARFDKQVDLAAILGPQGLAWANTLLGPLITHVPARATDPDAQELAATARSWLSFSTAATRHLKIHRNTVLSRLGRIEELLGLDLGRMQQQAELDLALRVRASPRAPDESRSVDRAVTLDELLQAPAVQHWTQVLLRPLRDDASRLESTLRAWLNSDARLSTTAETLGISVAGVRKRVGRLEQILQRSLLHAPHARYDLWLALRASDVGALDE